MMKKSQIKVFEELLNDENFRGKKSLRYLLWLNTSTPKFKIGECVKITDYAHSVYGHRVVNFKAKITNISSYLNQTEWSYEMEMDITCGDKHTVIKEYALESKLGDVAKDNINILPAPKNEHASSLDV